jgi:hypothetical protein
LRLTQTHVSKKVVLYWGSYCIECLVMILYIADDAFRLTIDRVLHPFKTVESDTTLPHKFYEFLEDYELPGYPHWENLWDKLGSMCKEDFLINSYS